jgi:hypothetical protein
VATTEKSLPTGISYDPTLLLVDTTTLQRTVLARGDPREAFNGPVKWSPDGMHLAYNFVRYRVNPAKTHPGPTPEFQTICVLAVHGGRPQCFPELSPMFDFDWVPDGRGLVITGPADAGSRLDDWPRLSPRRA